MDISIAHEFVTIFAIFSFECNSFILNKILYPIGPAVGLTKHYFSIFMLSILWHLKIMVLSKNHFNKLISSVTRRSRSDVRQ